MNFNSRILKISIVIALVLMLIPIAAAEDATDSAYAQDQSIESDAVQSQDEISEDVLAQDDQSDVIALDSTAEDDLLAVEDSDDDTSDDEDYGDAEDYLPDDFPSVTAPSDDSSADLEIYSYVTPEKPKVGEIALFTFVVTNNGPDTATNVLAYANIYKGEVLYLYSICDKGEYDSYTGIWDIGDLESGETAILVVWGKVLTADPIYVVSYVTSETPDPDESNNFYLDIVTVEGESEAVAEGKTLPATGNPILMVLLAALTMVGVTLGKRD